MRCERCGARIHAGAPGARPQDGQACPRDCQPTLLTYGQRAWIMDTATMLAIGAAMAWFAWHVNH